MALQTLRMLDIDDAMFAGQSGTYVFHEHHSAALAQSAF
jgi:hypothetical protein